MIKRREYLNELKKWKHDKVIKVITGLRRCGKSTLLSIFEDELLESGVEREQIISLNFEMLEYEELKDYKKLYQYIIAHLQPERMNYVFLDEIQMVADFQKVVDSLYIKNNVDLYITGSNAYLLSGELATLLSGRYVEINMLPLSFRDSCLYLWKHAYNLHCFCLYKGVQDTEWHQVSRLFCRLRSLPPRRRG